jgi:hypothetical protein
MIIIFIFLTSLLFSFILNFFFIYFNSFNLVTSLPRNLHSITKSQLYPIQFQSISNIKNHLIPHNQKTCHFQLFLFSIFIPFFCHFSYFSITNKNNKIVPPHHSLFLS